MTILIILILKVKYKSILGRNAFLWPFFLFWLEIIGNVMQNSKIEKTDKLKQ